MAKILPVFFSDSFIFMPTILMIDLENQLLRGAVYMTVGTIGKRMPSLVNQNDLNILEMLFTRLGSEPEAGSFLPPISIGLHKVLCLSASP